MTAKNVVEALREAMKGEVEAAELFHIASERTGDKRAKEIFEQMAAEGKAHVKTLQGMCTEIESEGKCAIPEVTKIVRYEDAESPIFTREFVESVDGKHFEISAVGIGIKLNLEASKVYKEAAEQTDDPSLKEYLVNLSDWKYSHYQNLAKQNAFLTTKYDELLRQPYWPEYIGDYEGGKSAAQRRGDI